MVVKTLLHNYLFPYTYFNLKQRICDNFLRACTLQNMQASPIVLYFSTVHYKQQKIDKKNTVKLFTCFAGSQTSVLFISPKIPKRFLKILGNLLKCSDFPDRKKK